MKEGRRERQREIDVKRDLHMTHIQLVHRDTVTLNVATKLLGLIFLNLISFISLSCKGLITSRTFNPEVSS